MPTVTNTLADPSGRGLQRVTVRVRLVAPLNPWVTSRTGEVATVVSVDTTDTGTWSVDLLPSDKYESTNSYYEVDETNAPGGKLWAFRVPDTDGPHQLRDLLLYTPPTEDPRGPITVAGGAYEYVQHTPSRQWTINHGLGYFPNISCFAGLDETNQSDAMSWNTRADPTRDQTILFFLGAVAGRAYCT